MVRRGQHHTGHYNVFILKKLFTTYGTLYRCHGNVKIRWRAPLASSQLTKRERKRIFGLANSTVAAAAPIDAVATAASAVIATAAESPTALGT